FGAVALRAAGPYFLIITLALGYLPAALAIRWRSLTGGDDGLEVAGRPTLAGLSLDSPARYLLFVAAVVVLGALLMQSIGRSRFGSALGGIKENAGRMEAGGYGVWLYRYAALVAASVLAPPAGVLEAFYNPFVSPADFSLERSIGALVAVILGG